VLSPPRHTFTRLLIAAVRELRVGWLAETMRTREAIAGIDRQVMLTAHGCPFLGRCPLAMPRTSDRAPPAHRIAGDGHVIASHRELGGPGGACRAMTIRRIGNFLPPDIAACGGLLKMLAIVSIAETRPAACFSRRTTPTPCSSALPQA
jgi:hypothetical protein